jgi:hypothetical protein
MSRIAAAGLIHYLDDTVVYGGIPFGLILSPLELLRRREGVRGPSESGSFGTVLGCTPAGRFRDLQRVAGLLMACSSLLGVEYFKGFSMPHMWVVLVGA